MFAISSAQPHFLVVNNPSSQVACATQSAPFCNHAYFFGSAWFDRLKFIRSILKIY